MSLTESLHRERAKLLGGSVGPKLTVYLSSDEISQLSAEHNKQLILSRHDYRVVWDRSRTTGDPFRISQ